MTLTPGTLDFFCLAIVGPKIMAVPCPVRRRFRAPRHNVPPADGNTRPIRSDELECRAGTCQSDRWIEWTGSRRATLTGANMSNRSRKEVYTTGEVAKICHVAPRTVSKWFDCGQIKGYRVPGSKDRRIPVSELVRFMRTHGIPLGELDTGRGRVLIVSADYEFGHRLSELLSAGNTLECQWVASTFAAGIASGSNRPDVMVIDAESLQSGGVGMLRRERTSDDGVGGQRSIVLCDRSRAESYRSYIDLGCVDTVIERPFDLPELLRAIDDLLARE
jgi:two-component system, OmpR family, response regulator RpaA